jgi:CBS domain-containing protein
MTTIRDVMATNPVTASSQIPVERAAEMMREHDVGCLPVVDDGVLTGILTDRDIVVRGLANGRYPSTTPTGDICSRELHTVTPDDTTKTAAQLMRRHSLRRLPVVEAADPDEGKVELKGMVSIGDLALSEDPESPLADISQAPPTS